MKNLILLALALIITTNVSANEHSKFFIGTYSSPPYLQVKNNTVKGLSINTMECIFNKLNVDVSFAIYPLERALVELQKNTIDGVFPVNYSDNENDNKTLPVSIRKWYWLSNFKINNAQLISNKKLIGTVRGSPEHFWLIENNYEINVLVSTQKQLFDMFKMGRVDAFIFDKNLINTSKYFQNTLASVESHWLFIRYESEHLVFSNKILANHPNLIDQFNQFIFVCAPISHRLTNNEKQLLKTYSEDYFTKVANYLHLHPVTLLKDELIKNAYETLDHRWDAEVNGEQGGLYNFIINSKLSKFLADLQNNSNNTITEILVIDSDGYTLAVSQATTDLYQGDEPKFINPHGANEIHISDILYDQSTQTYQSQISFPLPKSMLPARIVTFGVNIKRVLHNAPVTLP